jgi:hypothetical protein
MPSVYHGPATGCNGACVACLSAQNLLFWGNKQIVRWRTKCILSKGTMLKNYVIVRSLPLFYKYETYIADNYWLTLVQMLPLTAPKQLESRQLLLRNTPKAMVGKKQYRFWGVVLFGYQVTWGSQKSYGFDPLHQRSCVLIPFVGIPCAM